MAITSATYQLITPESESDSNYEAFEFLLAWHGKNGEYLNYLFTDWESVKEYQTINANLNDSEKLSNIISDVREQISLVAEDLTLNDYNILSSIAQAKLIYRVYKDGTKERIAIDSNSLQKRESNGRYDMSFNIILAKEYLPE